MSSRSAVRISDRTARIPVPVILPIASTTDTLDIGEHSTYSDILHTYNTSDLSDMDTVSIEGYNEWISSLRSKNGNFQVPDGKIAITSSTASLIKKHARKAKKAAKVDKFEEFKKGRDESLQPYYQCRMRVIPSQRSMKTETKKKREERGPSEMSELFERERKYGCLDVVEVKPVEERKVDINDALELRPILLPEDAKAIQALVKGQKTRLKPYMKKYSASILDDPIWQKWQDEDTRNLKRVTPRSRPPLITNRLSPEYGPASLDEVCTMVDHTTRVPESRHDYRSGELNGIVSKGLDPLDMRVLHHLDPPVYHPVPTMERKRETKLRYEPERSGPMLSRKEIKQIEMDERARSDQQMAECRHTSRPRGHHIPTQTPLGVFDRTLRSHSSYLTDDDANDPWVEKVRGVGALTSILDWDSAFINHSQQHHIQAAGCDTAQHRLRYGPPNAILSQGKQVVGKTQRPFSSSPLSNKEDPDIPDGTTLVQSQIRPIGHDRPKRKRTPESRDVKQAIDPRLDMGALRDIVMIPEAKIDHKRVRTVEPMASAHELTQFFADIIHPAPTSKPATSQAQAQAQAKGQAVQQIKKAKKVEGKDILKFDWRKHKSIQNPKWYPVSIRLSATRDKDPIPTFIANSVLQIRPIFRALENVNFIPVEVNTSHIQHVDMILSPSTGVIFTSLVKLPSHREKLMDQIKSAAFYFSRVIIVMEVVPYRLFKDPKALAECIPIDEEIVKGLSTFKRALELSVNSADGLIGLAEVVYSLNGADEVAAMLRGVTLKMDTALLKGCKGDTLALWQDKSWTHKEIDPTEREYLIAAGFNLYSTQFIIALCGSFMGFAEGMTAKDRLEKVAPVVGQKVVTRFNAKWWRRQMEGKELQTESATSETLHSG